MIRKIIQIHIAPFARNYISQVFEQNLPHFLNKEYQIKRDKAIEEFFIEASKNIEITPRKGIYLVHKNPYEYKDYYETLK